MNDLIHQLSQHPILSGGIALTVGGVLVGWLRRLPGLGIAAVRRRLVFTVEVSDREQCYPWFQQWLNGRPEMQRARDVVAKTQWGNWVTMGNCYATPQPHGYAGGQSPSEKPQVNLVAAPGMRLVRFDGRPVLATWTRREQTVNGAISGFVETLTFRFFGACRKQVEAFIGDVEAIGQTPSPGVQVWTPSSDSWRCSGLIPRRSPESLALADGLYADIQADARRFLGATQWYADRGIPHRRGYLLFGAPGTGKTTLPQVLAADLGMSLASLGLGDPAITDAALRSLFDNLGPNMMVVIEDVDCVFHDREAASEKVGVTLSGLLNVLDGIGSKEGRILFLTTNHPDRLDPALVRDGRIDRRIELGHADADQARRMFAWFFKGHPLGELYIAGLADRFAGRLEPHTAPAAIQEHLLRHRDDPAEAVLAFGDGRPTLLGRVDARANGHVSHAR